MTRPRSAARNRPSSGGRQSCCRAAWRCRALHVHRLATSRQLSCDLVRVIGDATMARRIFRGAGNESCAPICVETSLHDVGPLKACKNPFAASRSHGRRFHGMRRKPLQARSRAPRIVRRFDEAGHAVLDDLGHACDVACRCRASRTPSLRAASVRAVPGTSVSPAGRAVDARQHEHNARRYSRTSALSHLEAKLTACPSACAFSSRMHRRFGTRSRRCQRRPAGRPRIRSSIPLCGSRRPTNSAPAVAGDRTIGRELSCPLLRGSRAPAGVGMAEYVRGCTR